MLDLDAPPGGSLRVPMALEHFDALETDERVEWYDGILLVNPPLRRHVVCAMRVTELLRAACPSGFAVYPEWGWRADGALFRPDIMVAPIDGPPDVQREAPLLIVEVLSPGTRDTDLGRKRVLYATGGLRWYWVVDPDTGHVLVHSGPDLAVAQSITTTASTTGPVEVLIDPAALSAP